MKKGYILIAAAVAVFTACQDTDTFREINTQQENSAISFTTFTSKQTRADNSNASATKDLKDYNKTFRLWGNKYIKTGEDTFTPTPVFGFAGEGPYTYPGEKVEYKADVVDQLIGNWDYTPVRFWDKTASYYDFYAASPFTPKSAKYDNNAWTTEDRVWAINNDRNPKTLSLANFRVSGTNMATNPTNTEIKADKVMAAVDTEDLMIATDITDYKDYGYTTAPNTQGVQLVFNHILSRLNIGIRKSDDLANYKVMLKSIKVYNMKSLGSFNEETTLTATELKAGTQARWTKADGNADKFTPGKMVFEPENAQEITQTVTGGKYQYVYEGLVMPQTVGYAKTVMPNEDVSNLSTSYLRIDGYNAVTADDNATWSDPYIVIDYEIGKTESETYTKIDGYKYYFNLADVFNGNGDNKDKDVDFCEGWQNTLNITIAPAAIKFNPVVYNWDEKYPTGDETLDGEFTVQ